MLSLNPMFFSANLIPYLISGIFALLIRPIIAAGLPSRALTSIGINESASLTKNRFLVYHHFLKKNRSYPDFLGISPTMFS